jgi:hypothetical protein
VTTNDGKLSWIYGTRAESSFGAYTTNSDSELWATLKKALTDTLPHLSSILDQFDTTVQQIGSSMHGKSPLNSRI